MPDSPADAQVADISEFLTLPVDRQLEYVEQCPVPTLRRVHAAFNRWWLRAGKKLPNLELEQATSVIVRMLEILRPRCGTDGCDGYAEAAQDWQFRLSITVHRMRNPEFQLARNVFTSEVSPFVHADHEEQDDFLNSLGVSELVSLQTLIGRLARKASSPTVEDARAMVMARIPKGP